MPPRIYTIRPPTNPILQVLYFLVGAALLVGAIVIGAIVLSFLIGAALVVGLIIWLRVWWLKRKIERAGGFNASRRGRAESGTEAEVIEVEYTVVRDRDDSDK